MAHRITSMTDRQLDALSWAYSAAQALEDTHHCHIDWFDRQGEYAEALSWCEQLGLSEQDVDTYIEA